MAGWRATTITFSRAASDSIFPAAELFCSDVSRTGHCDAAERNALSARPKPAVRGTRLGLLALQHRQRVIGARPAGRHLRAIQIPAASFAYTIGAPQSVLSAGHTCDGHLPHQGGKRVRRGSAAIDVGTVARLACRATHRRIDAEQTHDAVPQPQRAAIHRRDLCRSCFQPIGAHPGCAVALPLVCRDRAVSTMPTATSDPTSTISATPLTGSEDRKILPGMVDRQSCCCGDDVACTRRMPTSWDWVKCEMPGPQKSRRFSRGPPVPGISVWTANASP